MDVIYETGKTNLVWLGPADESSPQAIEALEAVIENARDETANFFRFGTTLRDINGGERIYSNRPLPSMVDWTVLHKFSAVEWFRRKWVLQEAVLAKDSVCYRGSWKLPLIDVLRAAVWSVHKRRSRVGQLTSDITEGVSYASLMVNYVDLEHGLFCNSFPNKPGMIRLLNMARFRTSDPKDQVYVIL